MEVGALRSGDPERLGPYALIGRVGEGGQGTVFLAADEDGRQVAIKLLHAELTSDDKARARFLRELEVAKRVAPFCTAQVLDADADGERPYIVSEYVRGPSLNQQVMEEGPLGGAVLDRLAVGTATALAAIHQAKIVHRDFKPHNVLIGPDGPRVIDFGVARAISGSTTLTSRVIGTPSYMAPEQIKGEEVGTAADVFCWAATLAFAAGGEPPFGQDTIPAVINRILHEEPDLSGLDDGPLRDLVADCLDKDPARRPHARQLLMRLLGQEDAAAPAAESAHPAGDTDETAMLAAGSVLAAEIGDVENTPRRRPAAPVAAGAAAGAAAAGADEVDLLDDFGDPAPGATQGVGAEALPSPAEWAAQNTLPRDRAGGAAGHALRRVLAAPGRSAALAGAAALIVAVVVMSTVLALSSGDKGKAGQKVSDPSEPPASSEVVSRAPRPVSSRSAEPAEESSGYPSASPSLSPSASPTDSGSPTPSSSASTRPTPPASSTPDPGPTTTKPTDPGTDPGNPPGGEGGSETGTGSDTGTAAQN
ncbi:serine/threonine-protein kinase [Actinomadura fibrosa]|uniref:Serine/threonine-protein kinase n=2 Tax=Actinomadura fibrosa TaxID=111802 RepID=A0ABW2XHC8_9ACTN